MALRPRVHVSKPAEIDGKLYRIEYAPPGSPPDDRPGVIASKEVGGEGIFRFVPMVEAAKDATPTPPPARSLRIFAGPC